MAHTITMACENYNTMHPLSCDADTGGGRQEES